MKKSLLYMAAAAALSLGFTACSPDEFEGADPNARPTMDGVDFNPTVDQETNTVIATIAEREGCFPVWNIDGKDYSTLPTMSWSNNLAGEHTIELRLGNRNGFSDKSIKKTFKFDKDQIDYTNVFKRLCAKEWRIDYDETGHMGCGESGTDGSNWWAAGPSDKKDWGVYDDRISFSDPGLKGGTYTYNPGAGGTVYCNKDVATYGQYNTNDGNDYMAPVEPQTTTFTIETDVWHDGKGGVHVDENGEPLKVNYLVFPAGTLLPYVPNDAALGENNRWRIEGITASRLALVNDLDGSIAWRLVFTTKDEAKAFEGFNYGADSNMWLGVDNGSMASSFHYYYAPGWNPIADPVCVHEGAEWTWTLPEATTDQWQAQCPIKPEGLHLTTDKLYDFSCIISSNTDLPGVTVKLTSVETGDNYVFVERVPVEAGKDYVFYVSGVNALTADADCELFFDFGGNPANTDVTVRNITLKDHAIDDGTVLPNEEDGNEGGEDKPQVDWNEGANLLAGMPVEISTYYAHGGSWEAYPEPAHSEKDGVYKLSLPGASDMQWQAQYTFNNTGVQLSAAKKYDLRVCIESNNEFDAATIKFTQQDNDDVYITADRHHVNEGKNVYEFAALPGADISNLKIVFDFGGNPEGTEITISDMLLQEATVLSYDDPGNLWRSVDEGTNFLSVTPWFANDSWGQIDNPAWGHNGNEWTLIIPEGMGGSQWQGQFPINTSLTASGTDAYNFSCTIEADGDCPGVTIKLTETDEADGTKHDNNFFFADRHDVKADVPFKYTAKGVKLAMRTDAHALSLFFDFGGSTRSANVKIKDIIFEKAE